VFPTDPNFIHNLFESPNVILQKFSRISQENGLAQSWRLQIQLVAKKTGKENFPNVNLVLSICQLIVYLTIDNTYQMISKNAIEF
jgi:hypothetical protein